MRGFYLVPAGLVAAERLAVTEALKAKSCLAPAPEPPIGALAETPWLAVGWLGWYGYSNAEQV